MIIKGTRSLKKWVGKAPGKGTDTEEKKCHPFLWNRWEGERCGYRCWWSCRFSGRRRLGDRAGGRLEESGGGGLKEF